jgi:hypothetical protein
MSDLDLHVNLADIKEQAGFSALPNGKYHAALTGWELVHTQNAGKLPVGTPGINAEFTIQDGPHENRRLWNNFWVAETTLGFAKGALLALGVPKEDIEAATNLGELFDAAEGNSVMLTVTTRKYNGEDRNNIAGYAPLPDDWDPEAAAAPTKGTKKKGGLLP